MFQLFKKKQKLVSPATVTPPAPLTIPERRETLLGYLSTFTDEIPVTRQFLADRLRCSEEAIKSDVRKLINDGRLIFVRQDGNNGSIYKVPAQIKSRMKGAN